MEVTGNGVLEFKDPFTFFELPDIVQNEYLLKSDLRSIMNLCAAARLSKRQVTEYGFFAKFCDNYQFWKQKTSWDFPGDYARILRDNPSAEGIRNVEFWRNTYIDVHRVTNQRMIAASRAGLVGEVRRLLDLGADVDAKDGANYTALMYASENGHTNVVEELLDTGADPDIRTSSGWSALLQASSENRPEVVRILLKNGANPDLQNEQEETALIQAVLEDHIKVVEELLNVGVNLDIGNDEDKTALDIAVERGYRRSEDMIRENMRDYSSSPKLPDRVVDKDLYIKIRNKVKNRVKCGQAHTLLDN